MIPTDGLSLDMKTPNMEPSIPLILNIFFQGSKFRRRVARPKRGSALSCCRRTTPPPSATAGRLPVCHTHTQKGEGGAPWWRATFHDTTPVMDACGVTWPHSHMGPYAPTRGVGSPARHAPEALALARASSVLRLRRWMDNSGGQDPWTSGCQFPSCADAPMRRHRHEAGPEVQARAHVINLLHRITC